MLKVGVATVTLSLVLNTSIYAQEVDMSGFDDEVATSEQSNTEDVLEGFDDEISTSSVMSKVEAEREVEKDEELLGLTGKLSEQVLYAPRGKNPHNAITSVRTTLWLDYEHKFENGWRVKSNARAYYDAIYDIRGEDKFSQQEVDEFRHEILLFDAYIEGSITDSLDLKLGRQVIVWGRSETLRVTDILNPLDNRRPGIVDIEAMRLPVTMAKFDYFIGDWRVTPIAILEQRFSMNPPSASAFNPSPVPVPPHEEYNDVTYALSVGGEFSGWDINFYAARTRNDAALLQVPTIDPIKRTITHEKTNMFGTAVNVLSGSWLFKTELAYFDGLSFATTGDKKFSRFDTLLGLEYNGIADTTISYEAAFRRLDNHDSRLLGEIMPIQENDYQHAFRISSDFMHASLSVNYLVLLFGEKLDEGGFQRAWVKYELGEGINTNIGIVDYIGGSVMFDAINSSDMIFADITYSF